MARNRAVKSLGQLARLCLFSVGLIVLISFNSSQADPQSSPPPPPPPPSSSSSPSSANPIAGHDLYLEGSCEAPGDSPLGNCNELAGRRMAPIESFAGYGEFPYHVGVYIDGEYWGGGVLIGCNSILTIDDCVVREDNEVHRMTVSLGDLDKSLSDGEQNSTISHIKRSPNSPLVILFTNQPLVIGLNPPSRFNPVRPIMLSRSQYHLDKLLITGWGSAIFNEPVSNILKKRSITISRCWKQRPGYFCSTQLAMPSPGICNGYRGGSVVVYSGPQPELVGLIYGSDCKGRCQDPKCNNEYIDIRPHVSWMLASI